MTIAQTVTTLFSLFTTMVGPKIGLKLGRKNARVLGQGGAFIGSMLIIFLGHINWIVYVACSCFSGFAASTYSGFGASYIIDTGEYGYWKSGIDNRIVTNSLMNIPMKISAFVGGSLALYGLALIGWQQGMTITPEFSKKFMLLIGGIPAFCNLVACLMTAFLYKIGDKEAQLYATENAKRSAEALANLSKN
jgi:Na+/melibiose symporter-like transporter